LGVIISGLVHAAAEQSAPIKKMNCRDLAQRIMWRNKSPYVVTADKKGVLQVHHLYYFEGLTAEKGSVPCNRLSEQFWHEQAFEKGEDFAARVQEDMLALEHCIQESPQYADSQVKATLVSLKEKADLWPQCLELQRQAVSRKLAQEEKEREMDEYIRQHGGGSLRSKEEYLRDDR
jgi:hypothetical protein